MWSLNKFYRKEKSVVSGIFGGADASEDASKAVQAGTQAAIEEQRRQFDITQGRFDEAQQDFLDQRDVLQGQLLPYQQAGLSGLGNIPGIMEDANVGMQGLRRSAGYGRKATRKLADYADAGNRALAKEEALLGLGGMGAQQQAYDQFLESPGQKFLRERQEKSLLRNQAAIGGLGGGNVRTALQEQAAGIASTQLADYQNRLAQMSARGQQVNTDLSGRGQQASGTLAGLGGQFTQNLISGGQSAASNMGGNLLSPTLGLGQLGAQSAGNIGQALMAGGQAQASGILGAQQANAGLASGIIGAGVGLFSDVRLKTNIKHTDTLPSGIKWYKWDWLIPIDQPDYGALAHEVKRVIPEAVGERDGYLTVDYMRVH